VPRLVLLNTIRDHYLTVISVKKSEILSEHHSISSSLVDRGVKGVVAGNDIRIIFKTNPTIDIKGIDNHCCTNIEIGTVGGVIHSNKGPIIGIMNQYAPLNKTSSIHSPSILVPSGLQ
jgi:hypothetical protein